MSEHQGTKKIMSSEKKSPAGVLIDGGVGILPTDTIYGLVGSAFSKKTVERIYNLRKRDPRKPLIILISSLKNLGLFGSKISGMERKIVKKYWPGKVSIILSCPQKKFDYLHRGTESLAFRLPKKAGLINLLKKTGPLLATSVNPEGKKPAENINEAKKYFGKSVDFYADAGKIKSLPSTLIKIEKGKAVVLRLGAVKIGK